jgi:hypothetical protein
MNVLTKVHALALLSGCALIAAGCTQRTDYDDVQASRENVAEEQRETAEVRQETAEEIAAAERREAEARHEVLKPVTPSEAETVREAEQDTAETRREGAEAIHEEQKDAAEAKAKLRETEAKFNATKARDAFVADHKSKLSAAAERIEALKTRAGNEEGAVKDATQKQIDELQAAHDKAEDAVEETESADLLKWEEHRDHVKQAFDALQAKMDQTT